MPLPKGWNGILLSLVVFLGTWNCGGEEQKGQWVWGTAISPLSFSCWDLKAAQISLNSPFRQRFLAKPFAPTSLMSVRKPALLRHLGYTHLGAMGGDVYSSALSSLYFLSFFQVLRVAPIGLPWPRDASLLPSVILCSSSGDTEVIQRLSVVAGYLMSAFQL